MQNFSIQIELVDLTSKYFLNLDIFFVVDFFIDVSLVRIVVNFERSLFKPPCIASHPFG